MVLGVSAFAVAAVGIEFEALFSAGLDHPATEYPARPEQNAVSALNAALREGKTRLTFDGTPGYLRSALDALHVPVESQIVVSPKPACNNDYQPHKSSDHFLQRLGRGGLGAW